MHRSFLGVAAARQQCHRAIACFPSDGGSADRGNFAGTFQADDFRRARRGRVESLALKNVRAIDPGGSDANQYFVGLERRLGNFADFERIFIAGFFNDYCLHHL
jgi:hypothetical protein